MPTGSILFVHNCFQQREWHVRWRTVRTRRGPAYRNSVRPSSTPQITQMSCLRPTKRDQTPDLEHFMSAADDPSASNAETTENTEGTVSQPDGHTFDTCEQLKDFETMEVSKFPRLQQRHIRPRYCLARGRQDAGRRVPLQARQDSLHRERKSSIERIQDHRRRRAVRGIVSTAPDIR